MVMYFFIFYSSENIFRPRLRFLNCFGRNNLRPYFYGCVFVYAIMLCPHGSRALAIVDLY